MLKGAYTPTALVIADRMHCDVSKITGAYGLDAPADIWTLTDTYPEIDPYNLEIGKVAIHADDIIVFEDLVTSGSTLLGDVIQAVFFSSTKRPVIGVYDQDYRYKERNFHKLAKHIKLMTQGV